METEGSTTPETPSPAPSPESPQTPEGPETLLFTNAGITGLWGDEQGLSPIKLVINAVSRQELLHGTIDLDKPVVLFDFEPLEEGEYQEGAPIMKYELKFSRQEGERFLDYLDSLPKPVVFVTYFGYRYVYPILRAALGYTGLTVPDDVRCADFNQMLYEHVNNFGPMPNRDDGRLMWHWKRDNPFLSYKFGDVYQRLTGKAYDVVPFTRKADGGRGVPAAHARMLAECAAAAARPLSAWLAAPTSTTALNNCKLPHEIRAMYGMTDDLPLF